MPHISIKAEPIFTVFSLSITNSFLTSIIILIFFFFIAVYWFFESRKHYEERSWFFFFIYFINKTFHNFLGTILNGKTTVVFPFLISLFFFILLQNWMGLLPGVGSILLISGEKHTVPLLRSNTADLNTTLALGAIAVIMIQFYGVKFLGPRAYFGKFINFKNPINFFVGILEIFSEASRIISFSFRLFGNIFAGEVLLTVVAFLVPILASFPFLILEIFVGFIQAIVFTMLTAVFINLATIESH